MKEQGEGGEVLFPASLRDGLAGAVSEAVAKALFAGTLRPGTAWLGLLRTFRRCQIHMILSGEGTLIERSTDGGGRSINR